MAIWDKYDKTEFAPANGSYKGQKRDVYHLGEGPPIVILHELPGLSAATFSLADHMIRAGFSCYIPLMFGEVGVKNTMKNTICIRKEFDFFARHKFNHFRVFDSYLCTGQSPPKSMPLPHHYGAATILSCGALFNAPPSTICRTV